MAISADSYPSKASGQVHSGQDSGSDLDRFVRDNVRPSRLPSTENDAAPEREPVTIEDLHYQGPDPASSRSHEIHGALHSPVATLHHPGAHEPGFPRGFSQAKPAATVAESEAVAQSPAPKTSKTRKSRKAK